MLTHKFSYIVVLGPYFGCWGSLLGPYFTKNGSLLGPYLKAWGSLLVLEAVLSGVVKLHHIKEVVNVPFWQWGGKRLILHWGW